MHQDHLESSIDGFNTLQQMLPRPGQRLAYSELILGQTLRGCRRCTPHVFARVEAPGVVLEEALVSELELSTA